MKHGVCFLGCAGAAILIALAAVSAASAETDAAAQPAGLTPYKVVYALDFAPAGANSPIIGGKARLTIEFTGSRCTEYKLIRTVDGTLQSNQGPMKLQSNAVFVEDASGTQMTFNFTERHNGQVLRQDSLVARQNTGGVITATSSSLPGGRTQLPQGVVFPIHHERMAMEAIMAGRKTISARVYNPEESLNGVDQRSYPSARRSGPPCRKDILQRSKACRTFRAIGLKRSSATPERARCACKSA